MVGTHDAIVDRLRNKPMTTRRALRHSGFIDDRHHRDIRDPAGIPPAWESADLKGQP
jgi:hypothetical protein